MNRIVKYNLELMSAVFAVVVVLGAFRWGELSSVRQMTMGFMVLYTAHEWEESRFPGGFYKVFFSKCPIDPSIREETMHFPVAVYLLLILLVPFLLDGVVVLALIPLVLAIFEGFIHTAGIIIHQLKRPYSPGMITALLLFLYAIWMIGSLREQVELGALGWILGILLTVGSFFLMETRFMKAAGITIREFQAAMREHMRHRIKQRRRKEI